MSKLSIIGFHQATIVRDIYNLACELNYIVEIVDPHKFLDGNCSKDSQVLVGITLDKDLRKQVIEYIDLNNASRATIIHPTALIDASAVIGPGTFFGPYSSVFSRAVVGNDCIVGPYAMIGHKSSIGNNCLVHPGALIAGTTLIGNECLIGMRTTVIDHVNVCNNVSTGAGSLVTKDITVPGHYVGSPARKVS